MIGSEASKLVCTRGYAAEHREKIEKKLLVVCKVHLRKIILRDNLIREH